MPDCKSFLAVFNSVLVASNVIPSAVCLTSLESLVMSDCASSGAGDQSDGIFPISSFASLALIVPPVALSPA